MTDINELSPNLLPFTLLINTAPLWWCICVAQMT